MRATLKRSRGLLAFAVPAALAFACSPTAEHQTFSTSSGSPTTSGSGGSKATTTGWAGSAASDAGSVDAGDAAFIDCTPGGMDDDVDGDGWTPTMGDCDDCDPNVNPNAVEVPTPPGGTPKDENCNKMIDEPAAVCDMGLDLASLDPLDAARAVDLCKTSTGKLDTWGVVASRWVMADGAPPPLTHPAVDNFHLGHGMLSAFGGTVKVRRGTRMLALSSGTARQPSDPATRACRASTRDTPAVARRASPRSRRRAWAPSPWSRTTPTGVELVVNTPSNATGFSFDFDFFTYEWPGFICSTFNDFFVAILSPVPMGQIDGDISFDTMGNPVSVNNAFLQVCGCTGNPPSPCTAGGKKFPCSLGDLDLLGTGFGFDTTGGQDHGSTGWLQTKAPVTGNSQITLRWAVYDSTDGILDTTTLIDNWQWIANAGVAVGTKPIQQ